VQCSAHVTKYTYLHILFQHYIIIIIIIIIIIGEGNMIQRRNF